MSNAKKSNIVAFRFFWKLSPNYWILNAFRSLLRGGRSFFNLIIVEYLLNELTGECRQQMILKIIAINIIINAVISVVLAVIDSKSVLSNLKLSQYEDRIFFEKASRIAYWDMEGTEFRQLKRKIQEAANINKGRDLFLSSITGLFDNAINLVISFCLLLRFFLLISQYKESWPLILAMIVVIAVSAIYTIYFKNKAAEKDAALDKKLSERIVESNRLESTIDGYVLAKEIRLYKQFGFFMNIKERSNQLTQSYYHDSIKNHRKYSFPVEIKEPFQKIAFYSLFAYYALVNVLPIGQVTSSYGYVSGFINAATSIINNATLLKANTPFIEQYLSLLQFQEYRHIPETNPVCDWKSSDSQEFLYELNDVRFCYENSNNEALAGISLKIERNRKYAIVGKNGSGKSTLIKLLCNLYDPTSGNIIFNGSDLKTLDCEKYWKHISAVFQDFKLLSMSLRKNIALNETGQDEKIMDIFRKVGFIDRYEELPNGLDSNLYKNFDNDGIEISGGEAQKIAMARALYKDSDIIIFDEPTAALDPIAESEIYFHFNEATKDKTVIFISHRLASCKFCDFIIVMDGGKIVQTGTHEELLKDKNGLYNQLWMAQAEQFS